MCNPGSNEIVRVPIKFSFATGKAKWGKRNIDSCMVPIIKALNKGGIYTNGCCCGHGEKHGAVELWGGGVLVIVNSFRSEEGLSVEEAELAGKNLTEFLWSK